MKSRDYAAEFAGTFLLLLIGLSAVVVDFAHGSPVPRWIPHRDLPRLLTGVLFAGGATAIVYSPLGKTSGGHINPAVTLAFFRLRKITGSSASPRPRPGHWWRSWSSWRRRSPEPV
jgi:aquaporin Z